MQSEQKERTTGALSWLFFFGWALGAIALAAGLLALGCASSDKPKETPPRPGAGIAEYRQIASTAQAGLANVMDALARVAAEKSVCSAQVLSNFSAEVQRVQVDSMQLRARALAIQARGDAYFERWHENIARVEDPKIRALAEERRPLLEASFTKIKELSQENREAFKPFLTDLRQLRNDLEKDPANLASSVSQERIRDAMENGQHMERCLAEVVTELDLMKAMITPGGAAALTNRRASR